MTIVFGNVRSQILLILFLMYYLVSFLDFHGVRFGNGGKRNSFEETIFKINDLLRYSLIDFDTS